jgi:hypothetical protein
MAFLETDALTRRFGALVDALRAFMLVSGTSSYGIGWDVSVLLAATALVVGIGAELYPKVVT